MDDLQLVIEETIAFTAPELLAWKLYQKITGLDIMILNGDVMNITEADFLGVTPFGDDDAWTVYTESAED